MFFTAVPEDMHKENVGCRMSAGRANIKEAKWGLRKRPQSKGSRQAVLNRLPALTPVTPTIGVDAFYLRRIITVLQK